MAGKAKIKAKPPQVVQSSQISGGSSGSEDVVVSFEALLAETKANEFKRQRKRVKDALAAMNAEKGKLINRKDALHTGGVKAFEDLYSAFLDDIRLASEELVGVQNELVELERNFSKFISDLEKAQILQAKKWDTETSKAYKGMVDLQEAERKFAETQIGAVLHRAGAKGRAAAAAAA